MILKKRIKLSKEMSSRFSRKYSPTPPHLLSICYTTPMKLYLHKRLLTIHTAFASAPGRSAGGRIYAFITTSTGKDLARLLVANGYARALGTARKTPDGISHDEMKEYLRDLEVAAGMKRVGIWAKSDPDRLVELRQKQRLDDKELEEFKKVVDAARKAAKKREDAAREPININDASQAELENLPGIGVKLAKRIIANRPYKSIDDLLEIRRLGSGTLKKIRPHVCIPQGSTP